MATKTVLINSVLVVAVISLVAGCGGPMTGATAKPTPSVAHDLPAYSGPKAKVAVAEFEWKVGSKGGGATLTGPNGQVYSWRVDEYQGYTTGLRDMLTTVMVQSKRFRVLERLNMSSIKSEIALQEEGMTDQSGIQKGHVQGVDLLIMGAVTGWEPDASGKKIGLGGYGLPGVLGGGRIGSKKSKMALDIRIVDTRTSEVLSATRVEGEAKDFKWGVGGGGIISSALLGGGLSSYKNTPMEKAIRVCLNEAVKYISQNTPQEYMKYN
jgi:curli biogenesis system outer membrane secretion channel CsgG